MLGLEHDEVRKGRVAELLFASEFLRRGYKVYTPLVDDDGVDLLVERDGKYMKVQVRTARHEGGSLIVDTRRGRLTNGTRRSTVTDGKADLIAVYDSESKRGYVIPVAEVNDKKKIRLRLEEPRRNKSRIRWAEHYRFF